MTQLRDIRRLFVLAGLDILEKAPDWIKDHPEIKKRRDIKKVFPVFGLSNFRDKVRYQNTDTSERDRIIKYMLEALYNKVYAVYKEFESLDRDSEQNADVTAYCRFLRHAANAIYAPEIITEGGKAQLLFDENIELKNRLIFRKGQKIFGAFEEINRLLLLFWDKYPNLLNQTSSNTKLPLIDSIREVKAFHKINIPNKDYYVVFSATGEQGAWDICTMSERGIQSCQSWNSEQQFNRSLIGSLLSKYVGIIYLTSGSDYANNGPRMLKRCLVRFAVNRANKKEKVIILDQMYNAYDADVAKLFVEALQKRTPLRVLDYSSGTLEDPELPFATDISVPGERTLWKLPPNEQPYKDLPFLAKQPPGAFDKWKSSVFETTRKFKTTAVEIYRQTLRDVEIDSVDQLVDEIVGREKNSKNTQKAAAYGLDTKLNELIERTHEMRVQYDLRVKYIHSKMNKFFRDLTRADLATIINMLDMELPPEAEQQPAKIRDKIDDVIHEYRMNFYNMFK